MTTDMTDDVTPECPRCHESREALARERERTSAAATEMLNAARLSCSVLGGMLETRAILGAASSETVQEAATRVARERDEARAEAARLQDQRDRAELLDAAVAVRTARIERETREVDTLRRERDAAREEAARLRDAIDGRTDPPSAAEVVVHGEAGGAWLVTLPARPPARMMPETRLARDPAEVWRLWRSVGSRWVPVLDGRPCAWPVVPTGDAAADDAAHAEAP